MSVLTPPFSDPPYWTPALAEIASEITLEVPDWTWTSGGCFVFAEAFHEAFGGRLCCVCTYDSDSEDYPAGHAMVELNGVFYDARGQVDVATCISEVEATMGTSAEVRYKDDPDVFWFQDDFLNDKQMRALKNSLCPAAARPTKVRP